MTLADHLDATEYTARSLLHAIWHEQAEIDALSARAATLQRPVEAEYATAQHMIDDAESPDAVMLRVGRRWDN